MNTDNGALEFDSYFNNDKLFKTVEEAEKRVKGYSDAVVAQGEKIEDSFKITAENIKIQKDVIAQLETNLNNLNIEISKLKPGNAQEQLKQEAKQVAAELKGEKDALKMLEGELQQTETKTKTFRSQIREAREELIRMEQAGLRGTEAYNILQKKLGELTDALGDATAQANVLANDERGFQGVVSMVGGITGAFSAAQGAVGLFAGENENLNKIMLKVQSLMAITIGLQQLAEMLNKDSYFSIVILTKAKELLAVAEMKVATAMGISTAAARVLMATLTLGLSVAITAIIVGLSKLSSKAGEAKKAQQEFNKAVADNAAESIIAIKQMQTEWNALGDNLKAKEKYIKDNSDKFDDLGVSIGNVAEAERLLSSGTGKFIEAMILRAKAAAATELATEKYKESLTKQLDIDSFKNKTVTVQTGGYMGMGAVTITKENPALTRLKKQQSEFDTAAADLMEKAATFTAQEKQILKDLNITGNQIVEGSIQALEDSIARLEEKYKKAATGKERNELLKQLNSQKALLDKIDGTKNDKTATEDPLKKELDRKKNLYAQYYKWINSNDPVLQKAAGKEFENLLKGGTSYIDYLKKRRDELLGTSGQSKSQTAELKALNNAIADETNKTVLKDFEDSLKSQIDKAGTVLEVLKLIKTESDKLKNDNSDLDNAKKQLLEDAQKAANEKADQEKEKQKQEYEQLVADYRTFEQKKQAIIDDFNKKRLLAQKNGNKQLIEQLNIEQEKALTSLSLDELQNTDTFKNLFGNMDRLTVEQMIELRERLESEWSKLDLDPEKLEAIREKLDQVTARIQEKNPFAALADAIQRYREAEKTESNIKVTKTVVESVTGIPVGTSSSEKANKADKAAAIKDTAAAIGAIGSMVSSVFDQITGSLEKMGVSMDDQTQQVMNDISGMIGGAANLATGIATGNPLQIIQGSIDLISNGIDLIAGAKDRKLQRQIEQHKESVEKLKSTYEELGRAVEKALGTDVYKAQKQQIANLIKQQKEYQAMLEAEQKKRKSKQDKEAIEGYKQSIIDTRNEIEDIVQSMKESLLSTDIKSIANDLGTALFDAFAQGELAAKAWGDTVNDIVGNVIKNMIIQSAIEKPVGNIINTYLSKWVDSNGNLLMSADDIMISASAMGNDLKNLGPALETLLNSLPEDIKKYMTGTKDNKSTALQGAFQGASEETTSLLSGYANAIRLNQNESLLVMREHLIALNKIVANTNNLGKLDEVITVLKSLASSNLRAQGL
jgi:hypothetical protein